jgi:RHS repeat-associated protein
VKHAAKLWSRIGLAWVLLVAGMPLPPASVRAQGEVAPTASASSTTVEAPTFVAPDNPITSTATLTPALSAPAQPLTTSVAVTPTLAVSDVITAVPVITSSIALTATAIPTAPAVVDATPQATISPTATTVVTAMPAAMPEPPPAKPPKGSVLAFSSASDVIAGQNVEVTIVVADALPGNRLGVIFSEGLDFIAGSHPIARFDAAARTLIITNALPGDKHVFGVRVLESDKANGNAKLALTAGDATLRFALGKLAKPETVGRRGGKWALDAQRTTLDFTPDALQQDVAFSGAVFVADASPTDGVSPQPLRFRVKPSTNFAAPVTATLDLAGLFVPAALPTGVEVILFFERETTITETVETKQGAVVLTRTVQGPEPVASFFDPQTMKLTAQLAHFSSYAVGFRVPSGVTEPWKLTANSGGVSPYRGAATYQHNIEMPALPDGLQPQLGIAYNSAGADAQAQDDYRLGAGWTMDVPKVTRGLTLQKVGGSGDNWWQLNTSEDYRLNLNGQDHNLILKSSGANRWEYVTESYQPLRVVRCRSGTDCDGLGLSVPAWNENTHVPYNTCDANIQPLAPANQDYWQVWTPDGARWVFGIDASSTRRLNLRNTARTSAYSQWFLRRVYSPIRDNAGAGRWSVEYFYSEEAPTGDTGSAPGWAGACVARGADWEGNTRLSQIRYGNSVQQSPPAYYQVHFGYINAPAQLHWVATQANGRWIHQTVIGYSGHAWAQRVNSLQPRGFNGSDWTQRPHTTFGYLNNDDRLVRSINNGYGGAVSFGYWAGSAAGRTYHHVNSRTLTDGFVTAVETYEYGSPCFNNPGQPCFFGRDTLFPETRGGLMGYSVLIKSVAPSGGAALNVVRTDMHHDKRWIGQANTIREYNAARTQVLRSEVRYMEARDHNGIGQPAGTWLGFVSHADQFPLTDVDYNQHRIHTDWNHDNYGNVTEILELGYVHVAGDERSRYRGYVHNVNNWVVGRLGYENVHDGIGGAFRSQTILYYDGNTNWNVTPARGQLTMVGRGNSNTADWTLERYGYDSAGNLTSITDPRNHVSTAGYDAASLLLTWVRNALNHTTHYHYFHVNGGASSSQPWGTLERITDANNNATWYSYDVFGRPLAIIRPGDSLAIPTQSFAYPDTGQVAIGAPYKIEQWQRESAGCLNCAHPTFTFYDGWGRAVQVRSETINGSQQRVTNTTYDALGRPVRQFMPALEGFQWGFSRPAGWDARANTLTERDMLGRVFRVTEPSGVQTHHYFATDGAGYIVSTVDGRGHAKHKVTDGLGRLTRSRTFNGGWNAWTLHAEQRYTYDATDNLLWTRNEANHATTVTMGYDWLGRKTSMNDPSMGNWTYAYDLNGNLTRQTDARGIVLTFAYDALNRKTHRYANGALAARWIFDTHWSGSAVQNGIGRLTETATYNASGWEGSREYRFDARGRLLLMHLALNGILGAHTHYAYDSADRVTSMTYPNGEVVSTSYNDAMEPRTLSGASSYVDYATYNALGQPKMLDLGNNLFQHYTYWGNGLDFTFSGFNTWGRLRAICVTALGTCADAENNGNVRMHLAYAYDNVGNITQLGDWTTGIHPVYSYDAQDRLTSWSIGGTTQETYGYDALGRMTNRSLVGNYDYGGATPDWGCAARMHAPKRAGGNGYCYDNNGNVHWRWEGGRLWLHSWNADNKAQSIQQYATDWATLIGSPVQYFYDADGELVRRTHNGVTTVYVGEHAEWNSSTGWTNYYHFNGQRVAMRNSAGVFWLHGDHLGSASLITTNAGATSGQLRYDPYGQRRVASGNIWTEYTFTDQRQELNVGLMDYGARLYSPLLAQFISPDSIVPRPDDVQAFNRYGYARWNPMARSDPNGHADRNPQQESLCEALPMMCAPQSPPLANEAQMGESMSVQQAPQVAGNGAQVTLFAAKSGGDGNDGKGKGGSGGLIGALLRLLGLGVGGGAGKVAQEAAKDGDPTNEIQHVKEATVRLYRAVSQAEYDDIMLSGSFNEVAKSASGKYFATKADHAAEWGKLMYGSERFRVIAVDFPKSVVDKFDSYWKKLDGIGPAYYARLEQLNRYRIVGETRNER